MTELHEVDAMICRACGNEERASFEPAPNSEHDGTEHERHGPECPAGHEGHEPIQRGADPLVVDEKKELLIHPRFAEVRSLWADCFL